MPRICYPSKLLCQGKTALHLATTGGAHGWTKNVQRQENFKDCRAVAFEAAQTSLDCLNMILAEHQSFEMF